MARSRATQSCRSICLILGLFWVSSAPQTFGQSRQNTCYQINVVDQETGRGVPLVELRTTNELRFYTDSSGVAVIDEPGLMNQEVYFHVSSHGYQFPEDGFGFRGTRLLVTEGGKAELKLDRINIAERLYRVTGEGIYRDSVLLNRRTPIEQPLLNAQVVGQDSVLAAPYRDKIYWFWGDTTRVSYPLGNFGASGATSQWPAPRGHGLDPSVGLNLTYFADDSGFSRPMIPGHAVPGPGPKWLSGLTTIRGEHADERLVAKYVRMKDLSETLERGLVVFNDETASFDRLAQFDLDSPLYLDGHPFRADVGGIDYLYCGYTVPYAIRVRAQLGDVMRPAAYEAFSPFTPGTRHDNNPPELDRTPDGRLNYAWKRDTLPLSYEQQEALINAGTMKRDEAWITLEDVVTGKPIKPHAGSVRWNEYRKRWITIVQQSLGSSNLGEIWYAEADTPLGPWVYARKVVTHDKYSFYNPVHHSFFDQADGRLIYFEGTYSDLFSGSPAKTPRYDYNQIMYRLNLGDSRLFLPVAVYRVGGNSQPTRYLLREQIDAESAWNEIDAVAFFALPPHRGARGMIPIYQRRDGMRWSLSTEPAVTAGPTGVQPLFYALPRQAPTNGSPWLCSKKGSGVLLTYKNAGDSYVNKTPDPFFGQSGSPSIVPLYEYSDRRNPQQGTKFYSTNSQMADDSLLRASEPICHVWRNPSALTIVDRTARAVPPPRTRRNE